MTELLKEEEEKSNAVFQVGDYVFVTSFNSYGTITKKNKDIYSVNLGKMTVNVKNIDLEKKSLSVVQNVVNVSGDHGYWQITAKVNYLIYSTYTVN